MTSPRRDLLKGAPAWPLLAGRSHPSAPCGSPPGLTLPQASLASDLQHQSLHCYFSTQEAGLPLAPKRWVPLPKTANCLFLK